mgnify:CR=1 FL=1
MENSEISKTYLKASLFDLIKVSKDYESIRSVFEMAKQRPSQPLIQPLKPNPVLDLVIQEQDDQNVA